MTSFRIPKGCWNLSPLHSWKRPLTRIANAIRPLPARGERLKTAILVALTLLPSPAHACRGWQWETVTLLDQLPPQAEQNEIVARVEILQTLPPFPDLIDWHFTHRVKVRVIEPVKGTSAGQEFVVNMRGTSCDQNATGKIVGRRYSIAGRIEKADGIEQFTGRWSRDLKSGGLVKAAD